MKLYRYIPLLALVAASAMSNEARGVEAIDEAADMKPGGRLVVSNVAGSVEIRGWSRKRIEVTGELGDDSKLNFGIDGDTAQVEVETEGNGRGWNRNDTDLVIRVPRSTRVNASTVSADLTVTDIEGSQRLQTVSGDLVTGIRSAETSAKTVSGEIEISGNGGATELTVKSVSGDIALSNVGGEIVTATVSGDIAGTAGDFSRLKLKTVSGELTFSGNLTNGGRIDAESLSGDVRLELASLYDTEYFLSSFSGSIRPILDVRAQRQSRRGPGSKLEMTEGNGASRIEVETMSGDIDIVSTGRTSREPDVQQTSSRNRHDRRVGSDPGVEGRIAAFEPVTTFAAIP